MKYHARSRSEASNPPYSKVREDKMQRPESSHRYYKFSVPRSCVITGLKMLSFLIQLTDPLALATRTG